ncbi:MAG TPA: hypothetical protein DC042_11790 [Bacteroidales bacterium]|nr:hypothetical protein [Bacteroidales bacterium]
MYFAKASISVLLAIAILIIGCEKQNSPPVADFTFTPIIGNTDTVFTFDASVSYDHEDEVQTLQIRWDWTNDGTWDTDFSTSKFISHQFNEFRDYTIVMEVRDPKGLVSTRKKAIRVSPSFPVVKTVDKETVNDHSVRIQGEILKDGGSPVLECGACWSTHEGPTIRDQSISSDDPDSSFYVIADHLNSGMTYYFRTYAINSMGPAYGIQVTHTTPGLPVIHTSRIGNITLTSASTGGNSILDGGSPVSYKGVCWSRFKAPEISDPRTLEGPGSENFESLIQNLIPGTNFYVRAYAINSVGVSYGEIQTFKTTSTLPTLYVEAFSMVGRTSVKLFSRITFSGGENILVRGACWSLNPNPTTADPSTSDGNSTGYFPSNITGLESNRVYHFRAYATTIIGTAYSNDIMIQTEPPVPPYVSTAPVSGITSTSAQSGGEITDGGGSAVTVRGVCWSTGTNPFVNSQRTTDGSGNGVFESSLTELAPNTTYYVWAYAVNSVGTGYGNRVSFKTRN